MDSIERLLKEIKEDEAIWKERRRDGSSFDIKFSSNFLNNVADALLKVIAKFEAYPEIRANRAKGRLIIKTLDALKRMEV